MMDVRALTCRTILACLTALAHSTLSGCSNGELPLVPVYGMVTYEGRALTHGRVVFSPQDRTAGPQAVGEIRADGMFDMRTAGRCGAAVGAHRVTVDCRRKPTEEERGNLVTTELLIPARYARSTESPLIIEVTKEAKEYNIALD